MKEKPTNIADKIKFLREYYPNLRDWERKQLSDEKIINKVFQNFMDTYQRLLLRGEADRLAQNKYLIKNKSYLSWLDQYYIRDILKWRYGLEIIGEEESEKTTSPISSETTGIPFYDGMLKNRFYYEKARGITFKIEYMSPDEFLHKCFEIQRESVKRLSGVPYPKTFEEYLSMVIDKKLVKEYVEKMKKGETFPMPVLDYAYLSQEGRHRAMAAKELGTEKIPVMVVRKLEVERLCPVCGQYHKAPWQDWAEDYLKHLVDKEEVTPEVWDELIDFYSHWRHHLHLLHYVPCAISEEGKKDLFATYKEVHFQDYNHIYGLEGVGGVIRFIVYPKKEG